MSRMHATQADWDLAEIAHHECKERGLLVGVGYPEILDVIAERMEKIRADRNVKRWRERALRAECEVLRLTKKAETERFHDKLREQLQKPARERLRVMTEQEDS